MLPANKELLQQHNSQVHYCGSCSQNDDAGHHQVEAEDLASVDSQVAQACLLYQELAHYYPNPGQADIDFQGRYDGGHTAGEHCLLQYLPLAGAKGL